MAVYTTEGLYESLVVHFALMIFLTLFQNIISDVLAQLLDRFVPIYSDSILV